MRKSRSVIKEVKGKVWTKKEGVVNGQSIEWYSEVKKKANGFEFSVIDVCIKLSALLMCQIF